MEIQITNAEGQAGDGSLELSARVFGVDFNEALVHQIITAQLSAARSGTKAQKTRAQVRGGGAKPWRQKGTGRARSGTIRSPIWRGGGRTFAAVPSNYEQKVNKKMYRAAVRVIWSELARQDRLMVLEDLALETPKTKEMITVLKRLGLDNVLIVTKDVTENMLLASRNLINVDVRAVSQVDPVSLIAFEKVLITKAALADLEESLA